MNSGSGQDQVRSPEFVRLSWAAAMTLDFVPGWFYRQARLGCINLLMTYPEGCAANCAYCGLARLRQPGLGRKSFIRVEWPTYRIDEVVARIRAREHLLGRICISTITHRACAADLITLVKLLRAGCDLPISLLVSPTVVNDATLKLCQELGADKLGIALDAATEELFWKFRGKPVQGPHTWQGYTEGFKRAVIIYGRNNVGSHFIVGLGETELEMCQAMQQIRNHGGLTHLFSFFPEPGSQLEHWAQPPIGSYRRLQLARWLIDHDLTVADTFSYAADGRLLAYGLPQTMLDSIIASGEPFMTSGCTDRNGRTACNRPYANSLPGPDIRNYPFQPDAADLIKIRDELWR